MSVCLAKVFRFEGPLWKSKGERYVSVLLNIREFCYLIYSFSSWVLHRTLGYQFSVEGKVPAYDTYARNLGLSRCVFARMSRSHLLEGGSGGAEVGADGE